MDVSSTSSGRGHHQIKSCGICGIDQHIYHGHPGSPEVELPIVLGHELADGIVSGVYGTFLITIMTFKGAGGELSLGIYNTAAAELVAIATFNILAKFSNPKVS